MRSWLAPFLMFALTACSVERPPGSYEPEQDDASDDDDETSPFERDDAGSRRDGRIPLPEAGKPRPDARVDAGSAEDGGQLVEVKGPLDKLAGRYLMRLDLYSRVTSTGTPSLSLNNRMSNLFVVDVRVEDDRLVATEMLCEQTYAHQCLSSSCKSWVTRVSPAVVDEFFTPDRAIERTYNLDEETGKLTGEKKTLSLGFDEQSGKTALPTQPSDTRVWKVGSGSGVYTEFEASVSVPVVGTQTVRCQVSNVQRIETEFSAMLSQDEPTLEGVNIQVDISGTTANVIHATGTPSTQCTPAKLQEQAPEDETATLKFKRFDGDGCPTAGEFDAELAASPAFM